jgi:hypothetical protein
MGLLYTFLSLQTAAPTPAERFRVRLEFLVLLNERVRQNKPKSLFSLDHLVPGSLCTDA